jgi:hypothetical protein
VRRAVLAAGITNPAGGHSDVRMTMSQTFAQLRPAGSGRPRRPFVAQRTVGYRVR